MSLSTVLGYATLPLWVLAIYLPVTLVVFVAVLYSTALGESWPRLLMPALFTDFLRLYYAWRNGMMDQPARRVRIVVPSTGGKGAKRIPEIAGSDADRARDKSRLRRVGIAVVTLLVLATALTIYASIIASDARARGVPPYVSAWAGWLGIGPSLNPGGWEARLGAAEPAALTPIVAAIYHITDLCTFVMLGGLLWCVDLVRRMRVEDVTESHQVRQDLDRLARPRTLLFVRGIWLLILLPLAAWPVSWALDVVWACDGCLVGGVRARSPVVVLIKLVWLSLLAIVFCALMSNAAMRLMSLWNAWLQGVSLEVVRGR